MWKRLAVQSIAKLICMLIYGLGSCGFLVFVAQRCCSLISNLGFLPLHKDLE